jgi:hypothetical protein
VIGAILAPGKRTVTSALRIMGLSQDKHFQNYHRILNRAVWSSREVSRILLTLLMTAFAAVGDLVMGIADTIERRRGEKIKARGIYRDPVRSSHSHFVEASGLRWLSLRLLVPIPWAHRVWALPFLTALAPSERYYQDRVRGPKVLTAWARQMLLQVRRWLPQRRIVIVADARFAVRALLARLQRLMTQICMVVRFRLDVVEMASGTAVWYHPGIPIVPHRWALIRDPKGKLEPQALLCTDLTVQPEQILKWCGMRWRVEVTFQEVRAHLGVETQRQWNDWAILRTTPALLGLFSFVTLLAHRLVKGGKLPVRQAAWYTKRLPTFSDALGVVRQSLWRRVSFRMSHRKTNMQKRKSSILERYADALCYAQ